MTMSHSRAGRVAPRALVSVQGAALTQGVAAMLRADGWDVLHAETGALLESQLASWLLWGGRRPADLLVLDARMHAMEGMHLLLALARMGRSIPAVVVGCRAAELDAARPVQGVAAMAGAELQVITASVRALSPRHPALPQAS
jgi:DNA-binding response OmpR family regulator